MASAEPHVLVLGGTGFVGGAAMRALAASGLSPIAAGRRQSVGHRWRFCDATDAASVRRCVSGVRYAVNAVLGNPATMLAATRNLCEAARQAGVRRIVHVSSMGVYGNASGLVGEDTPLQAGDAYGRAKVACEDEVARFVAQGGEAVILRPGIVYGPGGEQWVGRIGRMLRAGRLGDLGEHGDGVCNLAYCDDVGAAVAAALLRPGVAGFAINIGDAAPPSWNQYFVALGRALGAVPVRRVGARWLACETRLLAPVLQVGKRSGVLPEPMPPSLLRLWQRDLVLDCRRADRLLGVPRTAIDVGICESAKALSTPLRGGEGWVRGAVAAGLLPEAARGAHPHSPLPPEGGGEGFSQAPGLVLS